MKKIILIGISVLCFNSINASTIFHKSGGGFFGYKYVTSTDNGNGSPVVACTDPGKTRCKLAAAIRVSGDGTELNPEIFEAIDRKVTSALKPEKTKGKLIFNDTYFVTYDYNIDADDLLVTIYSMKEAKDLGLIN